MNKQLTMIDIAFSLGSSDRVARASTLPVARAYMKADDEGKAQMRRDWCISYVSGNLSVKLAKAEAIIDTPRDDRTDAQQQSYDRARHQFKYHVQQLVEAAPAEPTSKVWETIVSELTTAKAIAKKLPAKSQKSFAVALAALIAEYSIDE